MKLKLRWIAALALCPIVVASCGQYPVAPESDTQEATVEAEAPIEDITVVRPHEVQVSFQNEHLRVLRFDLEPNLALPPHLGKRRVVYSLADYEVPRIMGSDSLSRHSWNKGDVHVDDAAVHAIKNTGEIEGVLHCL